MCQLYRVTGRVQGVWFRDSTRQVAVGLGISGYAKNMSDGSVEVLACGGPDKLTELESFLNVGPRMASVLQVSRTETECQGPDSFRIG